MGWVVCSDAVIESCDAVLIFVVTSSRYICDAVSSHCREILDQLETKIIAKVALITKVPGKFQDYETSEEEPVEQPRRHDLYGFVDHPQLQQGYPMNEFAPHRLPQPKGNMNGWLIEDEEEVERNEVDSDLESTASSKHLCEKDK
ncbi:hypothetical protein Tco_1110179 [Tanacetum coccineum]|uniref:TIR domain-containing protein n=1 Tax=Tanacetum coccineum TaxID=301880 RepID=A0ABQ5IJ95_9ASTR